MSVQYKSFKELKKENPDLIIPLNYNLVMKQIFQEFKIIPALFINILFDIDIDEVLNDSNFNDTTLSKKNYQIKSRQTDLTLVCNDKWVVNFESNRKVKPITHARNQDYLFSLVGSMVSKNKEINNDICYYQINFNYMGSIGKIFNVDERFISNDVILNQEKIRYNIVQINLDYLDEIKYTIDKEEKFLNLCELMITNSLTKFKELINLLGLDEWIVSMIDMYSSNDYVLGEYDVEERRMIEENSMRKYYQRQIDEANEKNSNMINNMIQNNIDDNLIAKICNISLNEVTKMKHKLAVM